MGSFTETYDDPGFSRSDHVSFTTEVNGAINVCMKKSKRYFLLANRVPYALSDNPGELCPTIQILIPSYLADSLYERASGDLRNNILETSTAGD